MIRSSIQSSNILLTEKRFKTNEFSVVLDCVPLKTGYNYGVIVNGHLIYSEESFFNLIVESNFNRSIDHRAIMINIVVNSLN